MKQKVLIVILCFQFVIILALFWFSFLRSFSYQYQLSVSSIAEFCSFGFCEGVVDRFKIPISSVSEFGSLKLGGSTPFESQPGDEIQNAYSRIPPSRFYVYVYQNRPSYRLGCEFDSCGFTGAIVGTMGGWLSGDMIDEEQMFGIPTTSFNNVSVKSKEFLDGKFVTGEKSLVVVANQDSQIVGLYPNKTIDDLVDILKEHPDLTDFGLLKGISELGPLKVGELLPVISKDELKDTVTDDASPARFSLYVIWNKPPPGFGCGAYECGYYHEFVAHLGGKMYEINPRQHETVDLFGLDHSQVGRGEVTLVVLTDEDSRIVAIHPNKIIRDVVTILLQHPELADFSKLYFED